MSISKTMTKKKVKTKEYSKKKSHYWFLSLYSLVVLFPFAWLLVTSFKTNSEIANQPFGFPAQLNFQNYVDAWTSIKMLTLFKNSIFICTVSVLMIVFVAALAGYVLSRYRFKINSLIYGFFIMGMMIPMNAAIIPLFINMKWMGLRGSYFAVIFPYIAFNLPMAIFLITTYMKGIPEEIEEAAVIDGCGAGRIFFNIILPLSKPILSTTAIIVFMFLWNEFLFALVFLPGNDYHTIPLGIMSFKGQYSTNFAMQTAGMVIAIIPTVFIYLFLSDKIINGMTAGAVKG